MSTTFTLEERFATWVYKTVLTWGIDEKSAYWVKAAVLSIALIIVVGILDWLSRNVLLSAVKKYSKKVNQPILNQLVEKKTFKFLAHLIPLTFAFVSLPIVLKGFESFVNPVETFIALIMLLAVNFFLQSVLKVVKVVLMNVEALKDKPVASFVQVGSIVVTIIAILIAITILTGQSILSLLTALGAMSAVLLLVFKDTLSGLAASIRISTYDMLRNGDWVEFTKYGADGTVIDINLATVKIQNFDMTYTTIPTSAFVSDAFKNWRGMEESAGRRIVRAINLSIGSVRFASDDLVNRLSSNPLIKDYVTNKSKELKEYNDNVATPKGLTTRNLTNLGLFRQYVKSYLEQRSEVNKNLTLLVRQLAPNEKGVPLQVYCFLNEKAWVVYEGIQSDIFDHLISVVPEFDLEIYENPSNRTFAQLKISES